MTTSSVHTLTNNSGKYDDLQVWAAPLLDRMESDLAANRVHTDKPTIFVLCNFVYQRRPQESLDQFRSKTTQPEVVRAVIDRLLRVYGENVTIRLGNSPLKSASWSALTTDLRLDAIAKDYSGIVELCDLRLNVQQRNTLGWSGQDRLVEDMDDIVAIDLGRHSLLDTQSQGEAQYRVLDYPHDRTDKCHGPGRHVYLMNRKIMEADLILSIPKLKTHEKVGMTTGIKGCVGAVGHKDCLAHHRRGGSGCRGDEYPGKNPVRDMLSAFHDFTYSLPLDSKLANPLRLADRVAKRAIYMAGGVSPGSWEGNDTAWRMAVDLARVLAYGTLKGELADTPQRKHHVVTDGVIAGEGQGPLNPTPVHLGHLSWSTDLAASDYVNALTMGIDPQRLKIVTRAFDLKRYPLTPSTMDGIQVEHGGELLVAEEYGAAHGRMFIMPRGW